MKKILKVIYDPDSKKANILPINPSNIKNIQQHIYDVVERDGSSKGYIVYISNEKYDETKNLEFELREAQGKLKEYIALAEKSGEVNDGR